MGEAKSEDALIEWIRCKQLSADRDVPIGVGDDMAMIRSSSGEILLTCDMLMDDVDFDTRRHSPEQIGRKALAVSLSDCAAMAVRPRWVLVSIALPDTWSMDQAQQLFCGIEKLAAQYECRIIGGDTNSWKQPLAIDITVVAEPWPGVTPIRRNGLRPGDSLWVTGCLGGSLTGRHLVFEPRVHQARALAERLGHSLHAMMDLSDGLSTDAARMAAASNCGIELDEAALNQVASDAAIAAAKADGRPILDPVLNDGEDFELFFAVAQNAAEPPPTISVEGTPPVTCRKIGVAIDEKGLWLRRSNGKREAVEPRGWQHFK